MRRVTYMMHSQHATCSTSTQWRWSPWPALRPSPRRFRRRWLVRLRLLPPSCTSRCRHRASHWRTTRGSTCVSCPRASVILYVYSFLTQFLKEWSRKLNSSFSSPCFLCRLFFRRHYPCNTVTFCDTDPQDRKWETFQWMFKTAFKRRSNGVFFETQHFFKNFKLTIRHAVWYYNTNNYNSLRCPIFLVLKRLKNIFLFKLGGRSLRGPRLSKWTVDVSHNVFPTRTMEPHALTLSIQDVWLCGS